MGDETSVDAGEAPVPGPTAGDDALRRLSLSDIRPNPDQPRVRIEPDALAALSASIAARGVIQPLVVRQLDDGTWEIIAGERRWRAAREAGLTHVPALVRSADARERLEIALVENAIRADLDPMELANACATLVEDFGQTHQAVAETIGRSRPGVSNLVRLLELSDDIQDMISDGTLTEGHGKAILAADGSAARRRLAQLAVSEGLSVREVERRAAEQQPRSRRSRRITPAWGDEAIEVFGQALDAPARVRSGPRGSAVVELRFADEEALRAALSALRRL
jgi:ParB family chromosome partitioning protein